MTKNTVHDILIVGSGGAGLSLALKLADRNKIAVLSKFTTKHCSTYYAQGGISAVFDTHDSIKSHIDDTINSGAGLCDPKIVRLAATKSKESINWLMQQGVEFTKETDSNRQNKLHLHRESGHSHRRVVHAADATGKAVTVSLTTKAKEHPNIELFESHNVIDLIIHNKQVVGVYVLATKQKQIKSMAARIVVLATGGASKVYLYTTNPDVATGDGIALAWRAGCSIANMEFMQFHPTCLYHPNANSYLISEAVRGEGGRLLLPNGQPFMHIYDPRQELAPRDIVAQAIDCEMKKLGIDCVYLDISHKPAKFIRHHFPTIYQNCLKFNIDITQDKIPVVPAAHYTCGGVVTDIHARTDLHGLYAIGETACTGLHGANRMASNSLLECLVFADQASQHIQKNLKNIPHPPELPSWDESQVSHSNEDVVIAHNWDELRRFMWDYVGIVRTNKRLDRAMCRMKLLKQETDEYYANFTITNDILELRNLVIVGELIIRCAQQRKESRGLHYNLDYPKNNKNRTLQNTTLKP